MIFEEKNQSNENESSFVYKTEEVFGKIYIVSSTRLTADLLDRIVMTILKTEGSSRTITGQIKISDDVLVDYCFERADVWEEEPKQEDQEEPQNLHCATQTKRTGFLRKLANFFEAFKIALDNLNNK